VSPAIYERLHIVMQVRAGQCTCVVFAHFRGYSAVIEDQERNSYAHATRHHNYVKGSIVDGLAKGGLKVVSNLA
jgi:hypothetical protein